MAAVLAFAGPVVADSDSDYERARAAMESGKIVPLPQVLSKVEKMFKGDILEVKLEDEGAEHGPGSGSDSDGGAGGAGLDQEDKGGGAGGAGLDQKSEDHEDDGKNEQKQTNTAKDYGSSFIIYEIRLLTPQGNVLKIKMDAKTNELISVNGHDADIARRF
ncbi:MAG: hypothetical protein A3G18_09945 [Rhodospirillales bacterium RIFCSPLOWO2_12_FULL_58_28]|nr:MAG: hypothetical protein A3H92_08120 [Rhodospirillales bacterium RIFCSPLOWO2_02_FULL_58_16]OHC77604.1 MAG: hypothetical protein A3G18_09945 [Rhodospirillales bacterium RIFCSPLOWO2_12_FULL_58_28]